MPDRIVYFGEFGNTQKQKMFDKAIKSLKENKGDKFYYLFPNGSLIKNYRSEFIKEVNSCFEMNLFTFDDIVNNTIKDRGFLSIDNICKNTIIKQVIEELISENKIKYYRGVCQKQGFIESLNFIIGEIKRSLLKPSDFVKGVPKTQEYIEIALIYKNYEAYLKEKNIIDREGSYLKAIGILNAKEDNFKDIDFIIIDEFYDFRPIEIEILKLMSDSPSDIYINMPFDMEYKTSIIEKTLEDLRDLGFTLEKEEFKKQDLFSDIGRNFFNYGTTSLEATDKISLLQAPTNYLEVKKTISIIKHLHRSGQNLSSIGLVVLTEKYKELFIEIAREEELPISIPKSLQLIEVPFIREILNNLEKNYENSENKKKMQEKASIENYTEEVMDLIETMQIQDKIKDIYSKINDFDLYKRDILAFEKLSNILSVILNMEMFLDTISFDEYFELFSKYLKTESIILKPENTEGIQVIDILNARGFSYDNLFILGLSQNEYPNLRNNNFLLKDENTSILKKAGIDYWDYKDRLDNEVVKFANLISMSRGKLYISYSTVDEGIPSLFLEEILDRFENSSIEDNIEYIKLELDYVFKNNENEITTEQELINHLLLNLDKSTENLDDLFSYYNYMQDKKLDIINQRIWCEYQRSQGEFNHYSGKLSDEKIISDLEASHSDRVYSASYLEAYSKCPYAFLLKNIMNIEEIDSEDEEYSPLDIGNIYHEILRAYYNRYKEEIIDFIKEDGDFDIENTREYLKRQVIEQAKVKLFDTVKKESLLILENIYLNLKDYIKNDIDRLGEKKEKMIPFDFEVEFGKSPELTIEDGEKSIRLMGKIDRIDKMLGEDKYIVIDYKSGSSGIYDIDSMREGLALQIPIYILSQSEKNVVLGMYGQVKKSDFLYKIGVIDQTSIITKKNKGAISSQERKELLNNTEDRIRDIVRGITRADFSVDPKECTSYCIYKDICRYDHLMEVEI